VPRPVAPAERQQAEAVAHHVMAVGMGSGDLDALLASLAPEIAVINDGGGIVHAAMRPVTGPARCARFLLNLAGRIADDALRVPCDLNGEPGALLHVLGGWSAMTITIEDGLVAAIRIVANPAKLERLVQTLVPDGAG